MRSTLFALSILLLLNSCSPKYIAYVPQYHFISSSSAPDYASLDYWAAHPWKKDPSDSLPTALGGKKNDSLADVFFIYPTTYTGTRNGWNADINDAALNAKTDYSSILYQASVFNQHCRIFSPRYRQAHLSAFFTADAEALAAFDTAYADIRRAFLFYLANYNHKRPLIIAGHSQGALMAERLLKEFVDGKPLQRQLVAAYIIGWPILHSFENIPMCSDPSQTGCACGWRTLRRGFIPAYIAKEKPTSYVTNPLSWRTDTVTVPRSRNAGSVLRDFSKIVPATTDAQVHEGVLWVHRPKFPGSVLFRLKNYHIADINLFYINLRQNIQERILAFR